MKITSLLRSLSLCSVLALAWTPLTSSAEDAPAPRRGMPLEKMKTELALTTDQVEELKIIQESQQGKMEQLRQNTTLSREQRREQGQALREAGQAEINSVLTPEQQQKFAQMRAQWREQKWGGNKEAGKKAERAEGEKKQKPGADKKD